MQQDENLYSIVMMKTERLGLSKSLKPLQWESPVDKSKDLSCDSLWQDFKGALKALLHQSPFLTSQMT